MEPAPEYVAIESKTQLPPSPPKYEMNFGTQNRFTPEQDMNRNLYKDKTLPGNLKFPSEKLKRIDYVLVYPNNTLDTLPPGSSDYKSLEKCIRLRKIFQAHMEKEGLQTQTDVIGEDVYIKIHTPINRMCYEAEKINLEMPLLGMENYEDTEGCFAKFQNKFLVTDDEVDFVSAPFRVDKMHKFVNHNDADKFFRPALRSFLTHHILINIDIRSDEEEEEDPYSKKGLPYLRMKKVYSDGFILHDETMNDPALKDDLNAYKARLGSQFMLNEIDLPKPGSLQDDFRGDLDEKWAKRWFKYQPLWRIRNYFGEKIALYFAWSGVLISTLFIPTLLGLGIFGYGLYVSITEVLTNNSTTTNTTDVNITTTTPSFIKEVQGTVEETIDIIRSSFDNEATPYFALIICLWGTIFLEVWKRKNCKLAYEWDVNAYEDAEPNRPEFFGTKKAQNPVIPDDWEWIYPIYLQVLKYASSFSVLIFMVVLVFICAAAVVLYRVFMTVDYCTSGLTPTQCLIVSLLASSVLQAVSIMILGKIYDKLAVVLTDWENHRTQTQYDDSLIIKTFAFQFANSYTSLFYIAFFRGTHYPNGIFGMGEEYQDSCGTDNNCMAMLSLQVLVLMVMKPLPRFLKDVILPFVLKIWRLKLRPCLGKCCKCCKCSLCCRRIEPIKSADQVKQEICDFLVREKQKPELGDFTLLEYTEKVIVYGFLMLFSASLPLAPLIALLVNWLDIRIDARRMLWWCRRPIAYIAQDIGMWYGILQFLNMAGVVTNAFLIAFTSAWGKQFDAVGKLWVVIGFEHIVFTVKFLLAALIPDIPGHIELSMKREKYQVGKILAAEDNKALKPLPIAAHFSAQLGALPPVQTEDNSEVRHRKKAKKNKKKHSETDSLHDAIIKSVDNQPESDPDPPHPAEGTKESEC